jgi:hypothetical protein
LRELEAAAADSLGHLTGDPTKRAPPPGTLCPNCGAPLQGPFCHACGQSSDTHKRSIAHLLLETIEGLFHFDGRLRRTLPDLFFRPGRLARDYMEGRIARHVPPFRTFLVALLLLVFAGEHAAHELSREGERQTAARAEALNTPQGRAKEVDRLRIEAATDQNADLKEATADRLSELKDPDENPARVQARYARQVAKIQARFDAEIAEANRVANGQPAKSGVATLDISSQSTKSLSFWKAALKKAVANPEYYLAVMFDWGHRAVFLLLPIVGLTLALVYVNRRRFFIYDHLIVAMNFLSFVFLANALGLVLPQPFAGLWLGAVAIWTPINLYQTLRGAYDSSVLGAVFKTIVVWNVSFFAFCTLLAGLAVFTLTQL